MSKHPVYLSIPAKKPLVINLISSDDDDEEEESPQESHAIHESPEENQTAFDVGIQDQQETKSVGTDTTDLTEVGIGTDTTDVAKVCIGTDTTDLAKVVAMQLKSEIDELRQRHILHLIELQSIHKLELEKIEQERSDAIAKHQLDQQKLEIAKEHLRLGEEDYRIRQLNLDERRNYMENTYLNYFND